jgi:hypothetical protein
MADPTPTGAIDRRDFVVGAATAVAAGALVPDALARRVQGRAAQDVPEGYERQTFLLLQDNLNDLGNGPSTGGAYASPAIEMVGPNGPTSVTRVGENVKINVKVHNRGGAAANGAQVEAFVSPPSTVVSPSTAFNLGTKTVDVSAGGNALAPAFDWSPPAAFAGHECLFARVGLGSDTYSSVFNVIADRHVAQRNIDVLTITGERVPDRRGVDFRFLITHGDARERIIGLHVTERRLDVRALRRLGRLVPLPDVRPARRPLKTRLTVHRLAERWDVRRDDNPRLGIVRSRADLGAREKRRFAVSPDEHLLGALTLYRGRARGAHVLDVKQVQVGSRVPTGGLMLVVVS